MANIPPPNIRREGKLYSLYKRADNNQNSLLYEIGKSVPVDTGLLGDGHHNLSHTSLYIGDGTGSRRLAFCLELPDRLLEGVAAYHLSFCGITPSKLSGRIRSGRR